LRSTLLIRAAISLQSTTRRRRKSIVTGMATTPDPHGVFAFAASLDARPDRDRCLAALARAFIDHRGQLWPEGDAHATPQWISDNAAAMLRVLERIYRAACDPDEDHPGAAEFLHRMAWLPTLIADLDASKATHRLDA
jgi:hypothetical protein